MGQGGAGSSAVDRGARGRAFRRRLLGRPGSLRRWLLGSAVFLVPVVWVFGKLGFIGRTFVFMLALFVLVASYILRQQMIGDEDELRAATRQARRGYDEPPAHPGTPKLTPEQLEELLHDREGTFGDAPPPPILDPSLLTRPSRRDDTADGAGAIAGDSEPASAE